MQWDIGSNVTTKKGITKIVGFEGGEAILQVTIDPDGNPVENGEIIRFPAPPYTVPNPNSRPARRSYAKVKAPKKAKKVKGEPVEQTEDDLLAELAAAQVTAQNKLNTIRKVMGKE